MDWFDLLEVQGTLKNLQYHSSKTSVLRCSAFFMVQLSHPYMTTGKTIALTRQTFVGKVMSLLFNMLSRLVMAFLPGSKHLRLILCSAEVALLSWGLLVQLISPFITSLLFSPLPYFHHFISVFCWMSRSILFGRRKKRNSQKQTQVPRLLQITSMELCFFRLPETHQISVYITVTRSPLLPPSTQFGCQDRWICIKNQGNSTRMLPEFLLNSCWSYQRLRTLQTLKSQSISHSVTSDSLQPHGL